MYIKLSVLAAATAAVILAGVFLENVTPTQPAKGALQQSSDDEKPEGKETVSEPDEKSELAVFMRKKLDATNKVMEGLCLNDMKLVGKGAKSLMKISDSDRWRRSNDMMYLHHSREFDRAVDTLADKAEHENADGAALAWMEVTMSCIRCHDWVRDTMVARSPDADTPFRAALLAH